jgi:hypothetical protein
MPNCSESLRSGKATQCAAPKSKFNLMVSAGYEPTSAPYAFGVLVKVRQND